MTSYQTDRSMPISLCGIKHAGKTCVAQKLAELLGRRAVDTDEELRRAFPGAEGDFLSVREIYRTLGEEGFRKREAETIRRICAGKEEIVIALGGGALSNPFLTDGDIRALGFLCCLDVPDEVAFERIRREGLPPFHRTAEDPLTAFREQNRKRREIFFRTADAVIRPDAASSTPEETAAQILSLWKGSFS